MVLSRLQVRLYCLVRRTRRPVYRLIQQVLRPGPDRASIALLQRQALHLGLVGWVRNQPDGSVALCAQGSKTAVGRLITFLEAGPPGAVVTSVTIVNVAADTALHGFDIRF